MSKVSIFVQSFSGITQNVQRKVERCGSGLKQKSSQKFPWGIGGAPHRQMEELRKYALHLERFKLQCNYHVLSCPEQWRIEIEASNRIFEGQRSPFWGTWRFPEVPRHQNGTVKAKLITFFANLQKLWKKTLFSAIVERGSPKVPRFRGVNVISFALSTRRSEISIFKKWTCSCLSVLH